MRKELDDHADGYCNRVIRIHGHNAPTRTIKSILRFGIQISAKKKKSYRYEPDQSDQTSDDKNIGITHPLDLLPDSKRAPSERIDGTHKPTNTPSSFCPENHK